jgi:hypothetical protein
MLFPVALQMIIADVSVDVNDTTVNPAGATAQHIINWLGRIALWGCLASLLIGAGIWGLSSIGANYQGASKGRTLTLAGAAGALLAGLAPAVVNSLFAAGKAG